MFFGLLKVVNLAQVKLLRLLRMCLFVKFMRIGVYCFLDLDESNQDESENYSGNIFRNSYKID